MEFTKPRRVKLLDGRYEIDLARPREGVIATRVGRVYEVSRAGETASAAESSYGVIGSRSSPPRLSDMERFEQFPWRSFFHAPVGWDCLADDLGIVYPVLVFPSFSGLSLEIFLRDARAETLSTDLILKAWVLPAVRVLHYFEERHLAHRALWPENIFVGFTEAATPRFMLGQCFTDPAGTMQPELYETPSFRACPPYGRGMGSLQQDIYALGLVTLRMVSGRRFLSPESRESPESPESIGSSPEAFSPERAWPLPNAEAYLQATHSRLPRLLYPFLRGCLTEDPMEQWSLKDILSWAESQGRVPMNKSVASFSSDQATAPLVWQGRRFHTKRELARVLVQNLGGRFETVQRFLGSDLVLGWLRAAFRDETLPKKLERLYRDFASQNRYDGHLFILVALTLLHPHGPIAWRSLHSMLTGFGQFFVHKQKDAVVQADMFRFLQEGIFRSWYRHLPARSFAPQDLIRRLDQLRQENVHLGQRGWSERFLYRFWPDYPCGSVLCENAFVLTLEALFRQMDSHCRGLPEAHGLELDHHLCAFLLSRNVSFQSQIALYMRREGLEKIKAKIAILVYLQVQLQGLPAPGVCGVLWPDFEAVMRFTHHRARRETLETRLRALTQAGNLEGIFDLLFDTKRLRTEAQAYENALETYQNLTQQIEQKQRNIAKLPAQARALSAPVTLLCAFLSALASLIWLGATLF